MYLNSMKKSTEDFFILLAVGFEFIGIVVGGAFGGYLVGKFLNIRMGVGEAVGTLIGLIIATLITAKILTFYLKKTKNKRKI